MFKQLEIRWVDLNPTKGAETQKQRPCVIIQSDLINNGSQTFIVASILPNHKDWPFAVNINPSKANGLDKERHINLKQLRAVDKSRIKNKLGKLETIYKKNIENSLNIIFDLYA